MIVNFLLLKNPVSSSKRLENSQYDSVYNTGKNEVPWSEGTFNGFTARQPNGPWQVQQQPGEDVQPQELKSARIAAVV